MIPVGTKQAQQGTAGRFFPRIFPSTQMVNEDGGTDKLLQGVVSPYSNLPNQPPDLLRSSEARDVSTEEKRE